jgi:hypothetical protein
VTEWTDEQRRQFAEYRRKGEEERAQKETTIEVGDHVETPEGTGWAVEPMVGGFCINLDKDLPQERPGFVANPLSNENAFFVPTELLRKIPKK